MVCPTTPTLQSPCHTPNHSQRGDRDWRRVCEFGGLERWNGTVEWSTGLDYWSATPTILHNLDLSMYSCMEVTVSLCTLITVSSMVTSYAS